MGDMHVQPVSEGLSPYKHAVGVAVGVGVGVGVDGSGVTDGSGEGVGVAGSTLGDGVAVTESGSQTASSGFTAELTSTFVTVGFENVGKLLPPYAIVAVPVGETKMMFEFAEPAVAIVHGVLQKTTLSASFTGAEQGPVKTFPR